MPKPLEDRIKKVDLASLTSEERDNLAVALGKNVNDKLKAVLAEVKAMANVYGLDVHAIYEMKPAGEIPAWQTAQWHIDKLNEYRDTLPVEESPVKKEVASKSKKTPKKSTPKKKAVVKKPVKKAAKGGKIPLSK